MAERQKEVGKNDSGITRRLIIETFPKQIQLMHSTWLWNPNSLQDSRSPSKSNQKCAVIIIGWVRLPVCQWPKADYGTQITDKKTSRLNFLAMESIASHFRIRNVTTLQEYLVGLAFLRTWVGTEPTILTNHWSWFRYFNFCVAVSIFGCLKVIIGLLMMGDNFAVNFNHSFTSILTLSLPETTQQSWEYNASHLLSGVSIGNLPILNGALQTTKTLSMKLF